MLGVFHLLIGFVIADFLGLTSLLLFLLIFLLGCLLPDLDCRRSLIGRFFKLPLRHRGFFHSLFFAVLVSFPLLFLSVLAGVSLFLGIASHLLLDLFSGRMRLLWPSRKYYGVKLFKNVYHELFFSFSVLLIAFLA